MKPAKQPNKVDIDLNSDQKDAATVLYILQILCTELSKLVCFS